jgi:uncharacterized protein (DUF111 family)
MVSPLPLGRGFVTGAHGQTPLPALAALGLRIGDGAAAGAWQRGTITELETHLDNDRVDTIGHAARRLMAEGALDVVTVAGQMKHDRPAHVVKVLANPSDADRLERVLFEETSSLGVRRQDVRRDALPRCIETVATRYGASLRDPALAPRHHHTNGNSSSTTNAPSSTNS